MKINFKTWDWKLLAFIGIVLRSIAIGVGFPEAMIILGLLGYEVYSKILSLKPVIDDSEQVKEKIKAIESKLAIFGLMKK